MFDVVDFENLVLLQKSLRTECDSRSWLVKFQKKD